jgi:hypothetical protein
MEQLKDGFRREDDNRTKADAVAHTKAQDPIIPTDGYLAWIQVLAGQYVQPQSYHWPELPLC